MNDLPTLPLSAELLQAYLRVSEGILSSAAPQDKANAGLSNDPQYARALRGLQLVAQYHQTAMMQTLTSWRQNLLEAMNTSRQRDAAIKRAVVELLFLYPAMMLLSELVNPSAPAVLEGKDASGASTAGPAGGVSGRRLPLEPQHKQFCELVQQVCFHWLLAADEKAPSESMPGIRQCLLSTVTEAIGVVSRVSLPMVGNPFLKHLRERVQPRRDSAGSKTNQDLMRAQILRLCSGMHHVQLTLDSDDGVREAVSWLRRAHPLDHTTSQRKSQVHHALAEMMSNILRPLVRSELPLSCPHLSHDVLDEWFALIAKMKDDIWRWTQKHDKHTKDGWTLSTILVCLLDDEQYPTIADAQVQFFLRQLEKKIKEVRGLVMRCLIQLIVSYLVRYGKGEIVRPQLVKWLNHAVEPLLNTAKKGGYGWSELLELTTYIAELAPEYAMGTIILELLTNQVPAECTIASLRALYNMVTTVPPQLTPLIVRATDAFDTSVAEDSAADLPLSSFTGGKPSCQIGSRTTSGHSGTTRSSSYKGQAGASIQSGWAALELLRRGMHPFDLLGIGHLMPKLSSKLSNLLDTWHKLYGTNSAYNNPENYSRERNNNVGMFCLIIRLIPYTKPDQWGSCKPLNLLPTYMTHTEDSLRHSAHEAALALVKGLPHVRNMMLVSYSSCLSSINDDQHQSVRAGLGILRRLAHEWLSCLSERAQARGGGAGSVDVSWSALSGPRDPHGLANGSSSALSAKAAAAAVSGAGAGGVAPGVLSRLWWCCELSGPDALMLDVHRLEGFAMGRGLVSADEGIRREALQFLEMLRSLHRAILEAQPYSAPPPPSLLPDLLLKGSTAAPGGAGADGAGATSNTAALVRGGSSRDRSKPAHRRGNSAHVGAASSSDGSSWLEGNMLVAGGESPQNPGPRGLADMVDPPNLTYLLDIIEQGGEHMVRSAYWDCGDWSDLWQACRPLPQKMPSLEALLCSATRDDVARLRLSRVLIALASTTAMLSPLTAAAAVHELCTGRLMRMLCRSDGRLHLPDEFFVGKRADAWRHAACMAGALPTSLRDSLLDKLGPLGPFPPSSRGPGSLISSSLSSLGGTSGKINLRDLRGLEISELVRALLGLAVMSGSGPAALQLAPLMALGHLHHEHYPVLVEGLVPVMEEYGQNRPTKTKPSGLLNLLVTSVQRGGDANDDASRTGIGARSRPDEARRVVAHVFRIVAGAAPREALEAGSTKDATGKPPQPSLRTRMVEWMRETYFHLKSMELMQDVFWDNVQVAYCLASVVRASALSISDALNEPLVPSSKDSSNHYPAALKGDNGGTRVVKGGQLSFRKALYGLLCFWSCEGFSSEENYASNVKTGITAVLSRYKQSYEEGALEPVRSELAQAGQYLDHAARTGMAALLAGPVFDADARRPQGPVLQWIERLLTHRSHTGSTSMSIPQNQGAGAGWSGLATTSTGNASSNTAGKVAGPERQEVARMALHNLLHANLDMFATCLDKCYDANRVVASSFFQVICEVYATQTSVHIAPHVMLSLILYKMVDESRDVREDSLHMLHVLSQREWGVSSGKASGQTASLVSDAEGGVAGTEEEDRPGHGSDDGSASESELGGTGSDAVVVLGNLQDSYQQFQYQLSRKLARDHLELSEALCEEMMTRALECWDSTIQHPVLICLAPWMENLIISSHWKGSWCERLLKSMYYVTQRHGPAFPFEIERLWSTLAASKRNIIPILDFLTSLGVYAALQESASLTEYFAVAKRIALYLARISPQHTIDHLAYEISLQAFEDDGSVAAAPGAPMPLSFSDITGPENIASLEKAQSTYGMRMSSLDTLDPLVVSRPTAESHSQAPYEATQGLDLGIHNEGDGPMGIRSTPRQEIAMEADMPRTTPSHLEGSGPGSVAGTGPSATASGGGGGGDGVAMERMPSNGSARSSPSVASGSMVEKNGDRNSPMGVQGWGGTIRNLAAISVRTGDEPILGRSFTGGSLAGDQYSESSAGSVRSFAAGGGGGGGGQGNSVRALLSRPELALCLLAEVAYEHDEDFRPHMPLLLHACICVLDQEGDIEGDHGAWGGGSGCTVSAHAQQLLMHLLYSVSARYIEAATDAGEAAECPQVSVLIRYLLSMRGRRLWAYEDADPSICPSDGVANAAALPSAAALSAMVGAVNDALAFEVGLQASWSEASLDWALHCRSRHLSCRSFQVFRALHPQLTTDVCCTLLVALHHCFAAAAAASSPHTAAGGVSGGSSLGNKGAASAFDLRDSFNLPSVSTQHTVGEPSGPPLVTCLACAQEIITTLKSLIEGLESSGRLVIYPQLFWVALALLHSSSVPLYGHALSLLDVVLSRLKLHQSKVAAVLLASAPTSPGIQAAGPLQQAAVTQGIWTGLKTAGRHRAGVDMEEQEEQPELWMLGIAPLGMMPYFQHRFDSPLAGSGSGGGAWGDLAGSRDSCGPQGSGGVHGSIDWGASPSGLGVRYAPLAMQQLLLRGLLVGDTAAASLRTLGVFADALAQHGYAASEHQRQRLRCFTSAPSACASHDTASRASNRSSMASGPSATSTVRAKGRPGSSIWGQDSGAGSTNASPNFPQGGPQVGLSGTIRHKPSSSTSHLQHEQQQHQHQQQQGGPRRRAFAGDSSSSIRGVMPSAWGETAGSHSSHSSALRPFDSLRAHATLHMDAHQSLLGPWQGQLFVSLVGVLQVMASLQSARTRPGTESPFLPAGSTNNASVTTKGVSHAHSSSVANAPTPSSADATISGPRRDTHTLSALVQCLTSLTHVATAHGLPALAAALAGGVAAVGAGCTSFSTPSSPTNALPTAMLPLPHGLSPEGVVPSLDAALQSICAEMARALFPRYAPLFIHHCLEELTAPGLFPQAHIAAITLLRSMMLQATASLNSTTSTSTTTVPEANANGCGSIASEIDLGPGVINSLTNTSLLAPLVERTQGLLAPQAVSALSAVMAFTTAHMRRSHPTHHPKSHSAPVHSKLGPGSTPSSRPGTPSRATTGITGIGAGASKGPGGGPDVNSKAPIVLRTLQPPPGSDATVAAAVKRVADTMGGMSARRGRRTARIIPYLNQCSQQTSQHQHQHQQQ